MLANDDATTVHRRVLYADGGTVGGSPGRGIYWSVGGIYSPAVRAQDCSGQCRWSLQAEFAALIEALKTLSQTCRPGSLGVIRMDSRSVVDSVTRGRPPRNARVAAFFLEVQQWLLSLRERGVRVVIEWVSRDEIQQVLGH